MHDKNDDGTREAQTLLLETARFRVERVQHRHADGATRARVVVRHPGAVTIIPMVDAHHVCLIRNYRVAVGQTLVELPAGTRDCPGEPPLETARRELREETGYQAGQLEPLHAFYLSPGILDEQMRLYLATELIAGPAEREPGEEIDNLITPWDEAIGMVANGTIQDAKTIVGLLLYDRIRRAPG